MDETNKNNRTTDWMYEISKEFYQFLEDLKIADDMINRDGIINQWIIGKCTDLARTIRDDLMGKTEIMTEYENLINYEVIRKEDLLAYFKDRFNV